MSVPFYGLQVYRANPDTTYFYIINDFLSLTSFEQENYFNQIYSVYLDSFPDHTYEQFKEAMLCGRSTKKSLILYKVKGHNMVIGFSFINLDVFHFKPNNTSLENTYLVISEFYSIYKYYQSDELYRGAYACYRNGLIELCPEVNIVTFHRAISPSLYDTLCLMGSEVYPSTKNQENVELDGLLKTLANRYQSDRKADEGEGVVSSPFRLTECGMKTFSEELRKESKIFAEKIGLEDNSPFIALAVEYLLEGNSLGMKAGKYVIDDVHVFDKKIYDPYLSYLAKL